MLAVGVCMGLEVLFIEDQYFRILFACCGEPVWEKGSEP